MRDLWGRLLCAALLCNAVAFWLNLHGWLRGGGRWYASGMVVGALGVIIAALTIAARARVRGPR